jgi:hypothetical protein
MSHSRVVESTVPKVSAADSNSLWGCVKLGPPAFLDAAGPFGLVEAVEDRVAYLANHNFSLPLQRALWGVSRQLAVQYVAKQLIFRWLNHFP